MDASTRMLDTIDEPFAAWDGQPAHSYGGNTDVVQAAKDRRVPVHVIWPEGGTRN